MEILILFGLLPLTAISRGPISFPPLIRWSFWIGLVGWLISTAWSPTRLHSFDAGVLEFLIFYIMLYLFAMHFRDQSSLIAALTIFVAGVLVISIYQTMTIISTVHVTFKLPTFASEFLRYKNAVPQYFREGIPNTYGNIGNYMSLWTLLMPLSAGLLFVVRRWWIAAFAFAVLAYCGLVVYSRAALVAALTGIVALWGYRILSYRSPSLTFGFILAAFAIIHLDPNALNYSLRGGISLLTSAVGGSESQATKEIRPVVTKKDASGEDRAQAWRHGISIGTEHWVTGIGYGRYQDVEPTLTSPHSMALSRFAESGILGLISFLMLVTSIPVRVAQIIARKEADMLQASCLAGVSAFMIKALLFGATFTISSDFVWAFGVALAIAATLMPNNHVTSEQVEPAS
jgi:O-antigen ligase